MHVQAQHRHARHIPRDIPRDIPVRGNVPLLRMGRIIPAYPALQAVFRCRSGRHNLPLAPVMVAVVGNPEFGCLAFAAGMILFFPLHTAGRHARVRLPFSPGMHMGRRGGRGRRGSRGRRGGRRCRCGCWIQLRDALRAGMTAVVLAGVCPHALLGIGSLLRHRSAVPLVSRSRDGAFLPRLAVLAHPGLLAGLFARSGLVCLPVTPAVARSGNFLNVKGTAPPALPLSGAFVLAGGIVDYFPVAPVMPQGSDRFLLVLAAHLAVAVSDSAFGTISHCGPVAPAVLLADAFTIWIRDRKCRQHLQHHGQAQHQAEYLPDVFHCFSSSIFVCRVKKTVPRSNPGAYVSIPVLKDSRKNI